MRLVNLYTANSSGAQTQGKISEVVTGIVEDIKDPQKIGRVKVNFPWLSEDKDAVTLSSDKQETRAHSYWARVVTPMAGSKRGIWFVPEVGEEVLVAFEHGDMDKPLVIGGLWNKDDPPPLAMDGDGKNDIRAIHTRSGHKIVLNDSDDKPSIEIVDKTGENRIFIDSEKNAVEIKCKGDLTIDVGGNITIAAKGKIDLKADQDLSAQTQGKLALSAMGNVAIESSGGSLSAKGSTGASIDGGAKAEVKGAMVSVNGSGVTEIKGGLVKIN